VDGVSGERIDNARGHAELTERLLGQLFNSFLERRDSPASNVLRRNEKLISRADGIADRAPTVAVAVTLSTAQSQKWRRGRAAVAS
jgi:hypothetical protein